MNLDILTAQINILIRSQTPYRSGYMASQWKYRFVENGIEFYNETDYLVYTNEKWISPRWRGRKNPNEKWMEETTKLVAEFIARELGGTVVFNG